MNDQLIKIRRGEKMKKMSLKLFLAILTFTLLLSACGGAAVSAEPTAGKAQAALVQFTGIIEAMDGDQWTINGQVLTVPPTLLRGKTFNVGDTIDMEVEVGDDGSFVVKSVDRSDDDNSNDDDDGNSNDDNDSNSNDDNGNDSNSNSSNSNSNSSNSNDDDDDNNSNSSNVNSNGSNSNDDDDDDNNSNDSNSNDDDDDDDDNDNDDD
jgi:antitoxin component of MazEF toxin-antitoxin module